MLTSSICRESVPLLLQLLLGFTARGLTVSATTAGGAAEAAAEGGVAWGYVVPARGEAWAGAAGQAVAIAGGGGGGGVVWRAAEIVEGLLAGLAAGGGYEGVDHLLCCWVNDVLNKVRG
jgi:hypothetical protein